MIEQNLSNTNKTYYSIQIAKNCNLNKASVGVYMIRFALLLAPLPIVAAALADGSRSMEKPVDKLMEHGKADDIADIPQSKGGSCRCLQATKVLLVIWAVLVSLLPYYITQIPDATPMQSALIWVVLSIVILIALSVLFGSPYSAGVEWKLLKATMITSILLCADFCCCYI